MHQIVIAVALDTATAVKDMAAAGGHVFELAGLLIERGSHGSSPVSIKRWPSKWAQQ